MRARKPQKPNRNIWESMLLLMSHLRKDLDFLHPRLEKNYVNLNPFAGKWQGNLNFKGRSVIWKKNIASFLHPTKTIGRTKRPSLQKDPQTWGNLEFCKQHLFASSISTLPWRPWSLLPAANLAYALLRSNRHSCWKKDNICSRNNIYIYISSS